MGMFEWVPLNGVAVEDGEGVGVVPLTVAVAEDDGCLSLVLELLLLLLLLLLSVGSFEDDGVFPIWHALCARLSMYGMSVCE